MMNGMFCDHWRQSGAQRGSLCLFLSKAVVRRKPEYCRQEKVFKLLWVPAQVFFKKQRTRPFFQIEYTNTCCGDLGTLKLNCRFADYRWDGTAIDAILSIGYWTE
jgi:hypothetical protein